jgi:hypothetical protein
MTLSQRERLQQVVEVPRVLHDPGTVVAIGLTGATAVVTLDRPGRDGVDAVCPGEGEQTLGIGQVGDLGLARVVVDARQDGRPHHRPALGGGLGRIQRVQLREQALRRADGGRAHVGGGVVVVVESHDVDHVHAGAPCDPALQHGHAACLQPAGRGRQRVADLQRPHLGVRPGLDQLDRLVAAVDARTPGQRSPLHVHVQAGHVVGGDGGLLCGGDRLRVAAGVADLGAALVGAPAAQRQHHVAAHRAQRCDVGQVAAGCLRL